ncbi:MAG: dihydrodipicolinate synthase family protein [Chlamydiales bacterium]
MEDFEEGIYAAALTPMHPDLNCHFLELANHCRDLIQRGCKGVVLFGTTGEGPSFSIKERLEALEKVIEEGINPKTIILGNGGANIPETVELGLGALKSNCTTLLTAPPTFFKNVAEEGVIAFYREIIQRIAHPNLRIILYHFPAYTCVPITLKIIAALHSEFPDRVIGIKNSEGNLSFDKAVIDAFPGFKVFVGNESHIIEAVHYGASGSICGIANLYPELVCSLFEQGKRGNSVNPNELDMISQALRKYPFIAAMKALMEKKRGSAWHVLRPPLLPLNSSQISEELFQEHVS